MFQPGSVVALLVKGGPVMVPLLICSTVAVAVVLERAWFWWRARAGDAERVLRLAAGGEWAAALRLGESSHSPVARVLAEGIRHANPAPALAMESATREEEARFTRYLIVLDTVVTLSPLLGLLGTVTGMIAAFGVMATSGINQPHAITGGVAEALIATATGLAVAIAALVPYNYFSRRADRTLAEIERCGSRLELLIHEAPGAARARSAEQLA
jgi:biopolymer transport protein ExbB